MAESKLFDFMNVELPEPKRSNIPWRFANRFTASPGYINVSAVIEVLPTDRWTGNLHSILRSRPTISSVYGSFRESHQAFFVPARLYSKVLDQLQTFGGSDFDPNADVRFPQLGWKTRGDSELVSELYGINLPCSLLSQLRVFPQMFNASRLTEQYYTAIDENQGVFEDVLFNAIPYVGYYDILRNYYFNDQELQMPFVVDEFDGDNSVDYVLISRSALDSFVGDVYENSSSTDYFVDSVPGLEFLSQIDGDIVEIDESFSNFVSTFSSSSVDDKVANHLGLGVRTYDDDYFTVSLNNEYVDELNNSARVVVSNGSFSVTQMQRANRLHKHVSRNVLRGSDYEDYLYVHFNAKLGREFNKPIFLGSVSNDFYFEDIYSTQVTNNGDSLSNNSLGTRAGVLNSRFSSNDGFIDFTANEYGFIMVLSSIIPKVSYQNNTPRMYNKLGTADLYSPEFDAWSFQDVFASEFVTTSDASKVTYIAGQFRDVVKSQPAWFEHLAPYDYAGGLYSTDLEYGFQVLTRTHTDDIMSSYIRPWEWNYIFQFQAPWFDNFEWQILFDFNAYRPISKQILPSM